MNEFRGKHRTVHTSCLIKPPSHRFDRTYKVCCGGGGAGFATTVAATDVAADDAIAIATATAMATFLNTKYLQGR